MIANFEAAFRIVVGDEGVFSDDPGDPGGETKYGRDQASWRDTLARLPADVRTRMPARTRDLSLAQAEETYLYAEWLWCKCDQLPPPLALLAFDCAVNPGPGWAPLALQRALGVRPDGDIGPVTLAAAGSADPAQVVAAMTSARLDHYRVQQTFAEFGRGLVLRSLRTAFEAGRLAA